MRRWFVASLVANMLIIVTGAVVRLTGSGLGCPTWPECFEGSYTPHPEAGIQGIIEFGNRLITFVLIIVALAAFVSAWRNRRAFSKLWWLTLGIGLGIPFQGVIGGIVVRLDLNPWLVALHLLLSVALIVLSTWALTIARGVPADQVSTRTRALVILTFAIAMVAIWIGTIVTGAGPHAGDLDSPRNGLNILIVARVHSASAWLLTITSVASLVVLRRAGHRRATRAATMLLGTVILQGVIGYIQYFTGLPVGVVILHLIGLTLVALAAARLLFSSTSRGTQP
ncbi:heme A synthase [Tessaracoccus antarcticus]|uniref:Heme A synthase n=2 Tax=Tessaracoccus antarcticus TaxID=2479848 RepID=A0A3M0G5V6_9ACTN|nr:heme A synthase [Tessaracoccus antarcticus]